jgi:hypothetical protein
MALATMADSRKILPVQSGADSHCALLMPLLLLLYRPGLPGRLTIILAGARNRTVTVRQRSNIGPLLSSIRARAHPPKGGSETPKGGFASGRATGAVRLATSLRLLFSCGGGCSRSDANLLVRHTKVGQSPRRSPPFVTRPLVVCCPAFPLVRGPAEQRQVACGSVVVLFGGPRAGGGVPRRDGARRLGGAAGQRVLDNARLCERGRGRVGSSPPDVAKRRVAAREGRVASINQLPRGLIFPETRRD